WDGPYDGRKSFELHCGAYMDRVEMGAVGGSGEPAKEQDTGSTARLVWNPYLSMYLAQSPARMRRRELTDECPFCADLTSGRVAPETHAWIRPNDFPPLRPPQGEAYILIYSADHHQTFAGLDVYGIARVISLWRQVYANLAPRYPCVMTWETS